MSSDLVGPLFNAIYAFRDMTDYAAGDQFNYALRLRGLPWSATGADIAEFLENRCAPEAVTIVIGRDGRPSGEALVGFFEESDWTFCKLKHKQHMGKRYVEVYDR